MSTTPQNPIPQFAKQPPAVTPKTQKTTEPAKKKHTMWWFLGTCCAIFAILLLVAAVLAAANWGRIKGYVQNATNGAVNSVTNITYQNETPNNATNTVVNSVGNNTTNNTPNNSATNNTTQNNTTTPTTSTEKNVLVSAVIAKGIDTKTGQAKNATTTFFSTDTIYYAILEVKNLEATDMSVDWFQGDTKVQTYSLKNISGNKFVNFYLDVSGSDADARVGDYQAKVYFGTVLKKTLSFSVTK